MSTSDRVGRTVRLTSDINQRLLELCDHLGVNPNAYLVAEIGKAVARDEVAFRAVKGQEDLMGRLAGMVDREVSQRG